MDLRRRQAQGIAAGVVQAVAALGLADIARHQGQGGGQFGGQFQQCSRFAFTQFQFQLADFFFLLADHHVAQVQGGFDDHLGLATAPGDFGAFTHEVGGEDRLEGLFVQLGQLLGPAFAVEFLHVELGFGQFPVVLVAFRQAGDALATGLEGLDDVVTVLAQAQGNFGLGQVALGGVEILVHQLTAFPATFVAFFQQRVLTQRGEGLAADAKLDFSFFLHGRYIQDRERSRGKEWLPRSCSVQD